ncbi:MAG: hypothetical protein AAF663_10835 [Planctomycetota bacterium]
MYGEEQLFDLANDPGELHGLADEASMSDEVGRQRQRMLRKLIEVDSNDPDQNYLDS